MNAKQSQVIDALNEYIDTVMKLRGRCEQVLNASVLARKATERKLELLGLNRWEQIEAIAGARQVVARLQEQRRKA